MWYEKSKHDIRMYQERAFQQSQGSDGTYNFKSRRLDGKKGRENVNIESYKLTIKKSGLQGIQSQNPLIQMGLIILNSVEDGWISRLMDVAWKEKNSISCVLTKTTSLCYFNPKATQVTVFQQNIQAVCLVFLLI